MIWGWWVKCVCEELQRLLKPLSEAGGPKVALMPPPQHGKSGAATNLAAWMAGRNPDLKMIFASYSADLGVRTNLDVQRIIKSENLQLASPQTKIDQQPLRCPRAQLPAAPYLNFAAITFRVG